MPLQKATMSLPFTEGVDLKTDQRLSSKPSRLENSVFGTGDLNKRPGRKQLTSALDTGGTTSVGEALYTFNKELVRIDNGTAKGLSTTESEWVTKSGGNNYCATSKTQLVRNFKTQEQFDLTVVNGIAVLAWVESSGPAPGLHVATYDTVTGTFFQTGATALASSSGAKVPRCIALGSTVVIVFALFASNQLCTTTINTLLPETAPTVLAVAKSDLNGGSITFDAFAYNTSYGVVLYVPNTGTDIVVFAVGPAGTVLASPATTTIAAFVAAAGAGVAAQRDTAGNIYILIGDSINNRTRFAVRNASFGSVVAPTDLVTNGNWSGGHAQFISAAMVEATTNRMTVVMTQVDVPTAASGSNAASKFLGTAVLNASGIVTAFSELASTPGLCVTNDFISYDGTFALGAVNPDQANPVISAVSSSSFEGLQATAWVLTPTGTVIARALMEASGLPGQSGISTTFYPRVCRAQGMGGAATFIFSELGRVTYSGSAGSAVSTSTFGISAISVTKANAGVLPTVQVGKTVYIGGGLPRMYDGQGISETGFALYPTLVSITMAGSGGSLSAGTYQYKFVYSWFSSTGELVRSITSPGFSVTAVANDKATLALAPMPLSMRDLLPQGATVVIEIYRTAVNQTQFNRQSSISTPTLNATTYAGTTSGTINVIDNTSDANLAFGELLYTTGGILDWEAPPAFVAACAHQQRLVVVPSEDPFSFMPSSQWAAGEQIRFSSFTKQYIPSNTGPLVGCASMDGKLLLLTTGAAYITIGDGPDQLANNPYPPVQLVIGVDTGPLPGSPVVTTPMGVIYQSSKGLTLIDRGLNQQFIGAEVEAYTIAPWTLRSILVHPRLQQIHFQVDDGSDVPGTVLPSMVTSQGGFRLVYDYFFKQWSVDPNTGAQDACIVNGVEIQTQSNGVVWQETPGLFLDNGQSYSSVVETPWVKLSGILGFQRLWYVELVGTYGGPFTLAMDIAYSFASTEPTTATFTETFTKDLGATLTPGQQFNIRHHIGKKCSAIKFRIRDASISGNGQGMGLTALSLEYGVKKGLFKLPAAQTM